MRFCPSHWSKLREAITVRGLDKFIAKDGEEVPRSRPSTAGPIRPCAHGFAHASRVFELAGHHPPLRARVCLVSSCRLLRRLPSAPARTGLPPDDPRPLWPKPIRPCAHGFATSECCVACMASHPPLRARVCHAAAPRIFGALPSAPARTGLPKTPRADGPRQPIRPCAHGFARDRHPRLLSGSHPPLRARVCLRPSQRGAERMPSAPARTGLP
jgi:hypothetical protein